MIEKLRDIFKNEIYKNVLILFSGSSLAQTIPFLATLLLTRFFTKEQFGVFFFYSSLCMVLSMIISLRLELAIVLPLKKDDGKTLFFSSLITSAILSFVVLLVVNFLYNPITALLGERNIGKLLYLLPISTFSLGIVQSCSYWFNRNKKFKNISITKITKSTISSIIQISLGFLSFLKYGLVIGLISGQIASAIYSIFISFKDKIIDTKTFTLTKIFTLINKYKNIPIYNTSITVTNTLSNHLPIFLLTSFYGLEMTAFYGLANRIVATPMGLISQSVGEVLYNEATKRYNNGQSLRSLVISTYKKLAKLAVIPFIILLITAPYLFSFLFGVEWKLAGTFTQFLIPWLFIGFLNLPTTFIITILNKQKQLLIYNILLLIFRFFALFIGFKIFESVTYSIFLFALTGVVFNVFLLFYIIKISNIKTNIKIS